MAKHTHTHPIDLQLIPHGTRFTSKTQSLDKLFKGLISAFPLHIRLFMSSMKISSVLHVKEGPWARCSWVDYVAPAGVVCWRGTFRLHPNCSCWARLLWYETEARQSPSVHSALTHILSFISQTTICCLWHSPCSHTSPTWLQFIGILSIFSFKGKYHVK